MPRFANGTKYPGEIPQFIRDQITSLCPNLPDHVEFLVTEFDPLQFVAYVRDVEADA